MTCISTSVTSAHSTAWTSTVNEGEIHGFLGPNGAGKSTTIRVLLGTIRATSGSVSMLGRDPWTDAVDLHREIAYVPGDVTLWPSLTGGEIIDLLAGCGAASIGRVVTSSSSDSTSIPARRRARTRRATGRRFR